MAEYTERQPLVWSQDAISPTHQAFRLLQIGFVVAPTIAGLDKFLNLLVSWEQYVAPSIAGILPMSPRAFMMIVGVIEIAAGLLVAIRPRIGGYVVAGWLAAIIFNLLISGRYFDIALRDVGLMIGAFALARLASAHEHAGGPVTVPPQGGRPVS